MSEAWEGSTDGGESFTGLQDGWGGFPGENKAREGPREERGSSAGGSEAWESATGKGTGSKGLAGASEA